MLYLDLFNRARGGGGDGGVGIGVRGLAEGGCVGEPPLLGTDSIDRCDDTWAMDGRLCIMIDICVAMFGLGMHE